MSADLELQLRAALAAEDPGELFTRRVLARLPAAPATRTSGTRRWLTWSAGLAATVLIAAGVRQQIVVQREAAAGLRAKQELLEALRVTSGKLDEAYEAVSREAES